MNQSTRSRVGLLLVCAVCCLAVVVAFSQQDSESVVDPDVYEDFMSAQVQDVYDLETFFFAQQDAFLPMIPPDPDFTLRQTADQPLPFDLKSFPPEFTEGLVYEYENSVPVFPVTVLEDPFTHETVFLNAEGKELYALPPAAGYDPYSYLKWLMPDLYSGNYSTEEVYYWQRLYSPDRIQSVVRLIPTENVEPYLYVAAKIQEAQAALAASLGGGIGLLRSEYSESNINFEVIARTNGVRMLIGYPDDFTNRLDVYMCNDLMQYVWTFAVKELSTTGTNEITWVDTNYWVAIGPPVRFYAAGNADLDTDGDGYADAREIMVFRTSETDSNSRPVRISGTVSYSGIETGTIWVLSTTVTDSWSIAQSVSLSGPGVYSNDIGNNQSYWFKAFRDVNSSYVRDAWEPWGVYSSSSTLITGDTTGLDITLQDQPSLWGAVDFSGAETGNVWVVAVTASDSWNTAYSSMLPWDQGGDPMTGGVSFLAFPASFSITQLPASNYWIRAFIDEDYDGAYTEGEIAGQYASNSIPVSNRITGLNFTLDQDADSDGLPDWWEWQHGTDANNPDTDGDGFGDGDEVNTYSTDPMDKYSVPPLPMLTASGKYVVDSSSNRVVLKSVNIGGWLVFEQWMLKFLPQVVTNMIGQVSDDHMPEATLRELLAHNVDFATNLMAAQNNGASGINTQSWDGKSVIGSFDSTDWIRFSNVNFGSGVSNFSVVITLGDAAARSFEIRLDSTTGSLVGTVNVADTGGWGSYSEQTLHGISVSGTHDVYFVGKANGVGNIYRFRFYRDTNTRELLNTFRDSYFATNDLDNLKALGYNCVRVPFPYDLIQDATGTNYLNEGWDILDTLLAECRKRYMWAVLDLHGTPGAQNGSDHSGQPKGLGNRLWSSTEYKKRLAHLWNTVAARYATNTTVAGYDLFNEPDPEGTGTKTAIYSNSILPVLDQVYKAIRSNDTQHIVFMMSNFMYTNMWADIWSCPAPASKGWTNVVYQFHHYDRIVYGGTGSGDFDFENQKAIADEIVRTYTRFSDARSVPVFIGEFMPVEMPNFDYFIRRFEASGIHWAHWNFRHWGHDDSARPWSSWGLDYRIGGLYRGTNTAIQPNVRTDSFSTLSGKLADYTRTNYAAHPHLPKVVRNNALSTNRARERTEFYLNAFSAPNAFSLTDVNAWPWRNVAVGGTTNPFNFKIQNQAARLFLDQGTPFVRARSREEADARFEIADPTGCWFSVDSVGFNITNDQSGYDVALNLCAVRDEITNKTYASDTAGIIARLEHDGSGSTARITVYAKNGGVNTNGTTLQQVSDIGYVGNATLRLFVNRTNSIVLYNGTNVWDGGHGLDLDTWADGAVCVVEAEQVATNTTQFADLDNIRAERPSSARGTTFSDDFSSYATGIVARAEPELLALRRWTNAAAGDSVMTNDALVWIPQSITNGGSWYGPKRDYHNDVRLDLSGATVAEVQVTYDAFSSSNFHAKIAVVPEYFTGEISNQYVGVALYLEMAYRLPPETNAGNLAFGVWRHTGPGTRESVALNDSMAFVPGQVVSFQVSTNWCEVYYGTNLLVSQAHGLTNAGILYTDGLYPHLEIKNRGASVNLTAQLGGVLCRQRSGFGAP